MTNPDALARYIMIGGFLGAGKSTAIARLAEHLSARGLRVGLITNDQGNRLVDTLNLASRGFDVEEIPGGCFCCRFDSLMEAAENLSRETRPDVFIAEPVGSCTDLVASVSYPLRRIYGDQYRVAPLSVLVDPRRARRVLGLSDERGFSEKVTYIYMKQLEEAAMIVINKRDLLDDAEYAQLADALRARFPEAEVIGISAREGWELEPWFDAIWDRELPLGETMPLDYRIYAEGEALLGWLNASLKLRAAALTAGDSLLQNLALAVQKRLNSLHIEIAHFKMTLDPLDGSGEIAVLNLVGSDYRPEFTQSLMDPLQQGELIVNLRAEGDPEQLRAVLEDAVASCQNDVVRWELDHLECFRPGEPKPIYRMAHAEADV
ncbi:GTP-binding protein [Acanthopleuribacter pedis]|uniref:CobW/HypB/UreG nucleotide-binding domain-containing protein n=1 Tax=Acanthopleuribacter pedis TaxID=442870 RepID=A0A8J7QQP3_9BACT|nr:GTP-binding protein [Acanthopleuribacter pedis]MBO1323090.1 hypothetical protein [Acanthopleuribacter pedis]